MGYFIRSLPWKKSAPQWKLQYISYKKSDVLHSTAKRPKRAWDITSERWQVLGFHQTMTHSEAKSRARQLNSQLQLKRQEEQIRKIAKDQAQTQLRYDATLPSEFVAEFEERFIKKRDSQTERGFRRTTRARTIWRAAQKMIFAIAIEPSEWFYCTYQIYDYFCAQKMSMKYTLSILKFANLWGFYICKKMARPFLPIPFPRGHERQRLIDANLEKPGGVRRASAPIHPLDLERVREQINRRNFNWVFLSIWFGLRPTEVDNLHKKDLWRVELLPTGRKILWVFQTKIIALPYEDRWKPIPILYDEQMFALKIIEGKNFKRPLGKTMRKYFGMGTTLYGGRKGFPDLMLSKNQAFENISVWMGHSTLDRTWQSYKSRRKFHIAGF